MPVRETVAFGAKVDVVRLPTSKVTVPEVVVERAVAFPDADDADFMELESEDTVMVVVTDAYVTEPVAPSMLRGSMVLDSISNETESEAEEAEEAEEVVEEVEEEVEEDDDCVVVDWANAPVSSAAAIHNERIFSSRTL